MTRDNDPDAESDRLERRLDQIHAHLTELESRQRGMLDETRIRWREEDAILQRLVLRAEVEIESERRQRDHIQDSRDRLARFREESGYDELWDDDNPLVSVRIATFDRTEQLIDVAIESVLKQTYDNIEIVVVNDGPNPRTQAALKALGNDKIRYSELPRRTDYPQHQHLRWMVAGAAAMNEAARQAQGKWIAPLDDDDEFADDHIERILRLARSERAELAYGALIRRDLDEGTKELIFSDPPVIGKFSFQSSIYLEGLRFFSYDEESWRVEEPGDGNLIRRMREAGVRFAGTPDVHAFMNSHRFDRRDS
ncbi:glycosyltransferase family 2 protein [Microbacterium lacus]|uniref:glycosyltransferase family 2 protein n=1 Tax=Microbacterium lacus TaxID=415217 RepID=UPI000C2C6E03|nr:glycosyltransferase [Microbacterium lacus]